MARIRIVDEWLRSPASPPTYYRSIMVVAERWAEQRVLMRAYAESPDQTRPTIVLHGTEVAIGPAGTDPNGEWGVHVQPPADGRAQELKEQLELAAKRLAGSKGNAPRLADEQPEFERKRTNNWAPGAPRDVPGAPIPQAGWDPAVAASQWGASASSSTSAASSSSNAAPYGSAPAVPQPYAPAPPNAATYFPNPQVAQYVPPPAAVSVPQHQAAAYVPAAPAAERVPQGGIAADTGMTVSPPSNPGLRLTPVPQPAADHRRRRQTGSHGRAGRTALGHASGAGAQSAVIRLGLRPAAASRLGRLVGVTVPADFEITQVEREVLNALGERDQMTARAIGDLVGVVDAVSWMETLVDKLERFGIDIVGPGEPSGSEPTYLLRR